MKLNPALTKASARALQKMLDENEEIVMEGILAYIGTTRISIATVYHLLRECLIKDVSDCGGGMKRYEAYSECRQVLSDPTYETRWREHLRTGKNVNR